MDEQTDPKKGLFKTTGKKIATRWILNATANYCTVYNIHWKVHNLNLPATRWINTIKSIQELFWEQRKSECIQNNQVTTTLKKFKMLGIKFSGKNPVME